MFGNPFFGQGMKKLNRREFNESPAARTSINRYYAQRQMHKSVGKVKQCYVTLLRSMPSLLKESPKTLFSANSIFLSFYNNNNVQE